MSWVRPRAPAGETAFALKLDSWRTSPASSAGSMPLRCAAAVISSPYGTPVSEAPVPVGVVAAVAPARVDPVVPAEARVPPAAVRAGEAAAAGPAGRPEAAEA